MKGRKPKPSKLHDLHGTTNVTRHKARLAGEPIPETEIQDDAPSWMTESQKDCWRYALANAPKGVLKAIDRGILAVWVEAEDRHRRACIEQAKLDQTDTLPMLTKVGGKEGRDGKVTGFSIIQSPYLGIINRAAQLMLKAASELGFSPVSRPRIAAATGTNPNAPDLPAPNEKPAAGSGSYAEYIASRPGQTQH